jgi:hypothetical protein
LELGHAMLLIYRFLSRAAEGYVLRLEPNIPMKKYDMFQSVYSGWGNCSTVQLIIYVLVLFVKTENNFFKSIALSVFAQVLACCSDKRSMKKKSGKRW